MERYLRLVYKLSSTQVVEIVRLALEERYEIESSTYLFLGGMVNCGFVQTVAIERYSRERITFMTKLVEGEQNQDETFYRVVYPMIETLQPMIPRLVDLRTLQGLTLLTTEKVDGHAPSEEDFEIVLEASRAIETFPHERVMAIFGALDINVQERFYISKWSLKQMYLTTYLTLASKIDDLDQIFTTFTRLYRMLRDIKIYRLATTANYSFCHGDLNRANILIQNGTTRVLDWTHFRVAPLGYDIAYYFKNSSLDFTAFREAFLDSRFPIHDGVRQNAVACVLFIHQLIYLRIKHSKPTELEPDYERFFLPAVEYAIEIASRYLGYRVPRQKGITT